MKMRHRLRPLLGLFTLLALLLAYTTPTLAATSPGGVVDDRSDSWSEAKLSDLEEALAGRRFAYRVLILGQAFPDPAPADKEARFQEMAAQFVNDLALPDDGVLITVAMKEQLVDFRVRVGGQVDTTFRDATGSTFGASAKSMLQAFSGPARSGDMPRAILAAVDRIEELAVVPPPVTVPASPALPAPPPVPQVPPSQPIQPVQLAQPNQVSSAPQEGESAWPWLLGGSAIVAGGLWAGTAFRYRRRRKEVLALRDTFLGDLLKLIQQDLPMGKRYAGAETAKPVAMAAAAADRSLQAHETGTSHFEQAERRARQTRVFSAVKALEAARGCYEEAATAQHEARQSYQPLTDAIQGWEAALATAAAHKGQGETGLADLHASTGWELEALRQLHAEGADRQQEGERARSDDPVRAIHLVREGDGQFQAVLDQTARLRELQVAFEQHQVRRAQVAVAIQECRGLQGLRFVEADPDASIHQAIARAEEAARQMAAGVVEAASAALDGAVQAAEEAMAIVERYRQAIAEYPGKVERLTRETRHLEGEVGVARQVIDDLRQRFDAVDWEELRPLPDQMVAFGQQVWAGLQETARLTSREEQRYLKAGDLLDRWLAQRERLTSNLALLRSRPEQFEAMERHAREMLAAAEKEWEVLAKATSRFALLLPPHLSEQWTTCEASLNSARRLVGQRPLRVSRAVEDASQALELASRLRRDVEALKRQALDARDRLERAQAEAQASLRYASYDSHHAGRLQQALRAAERAVATGQYVAALNEAQSALQSSAALVHAYSQYQQEQERQRQAAMSHHSHDSSGGGGSWGSSSDTSGGGGSFGGSDSSNNTSGGGGSWG